MRTTYILDTSVLIDDPSAYKHFKNSDIVIPITVINELDKKKLVTGESGRNARICIRMLDQISDMGSISVGVLLDDDIFLRVDTTFRNVAEDYKSLGDPTYGDTHIMACVIDHYRNHPNNDVILVSNDLNLRLRVKAQGIKAQGYEYNKSSLSELYAGNQILANEDAGLDLQKKGNINPFNYGINLSMNECMLFTRGNGEELSMGRKVAEDKIKLIKKVYPWGLSSRNKEQTYAIDLIMDNNLDLVTLAGKAGSGKSLITIGSALELVLEKKKYERLVIYRPIQSVGNELGALPGELDEKLAPYFQAIMDSFEVLFSNKHQKRGDWKRDLELYRRQGRIELEAITFIRGRSIPNSIMMIDECFPYNQTIEIENNKQEQIGILFDMWSRKKILPLVKTYNEQLNKFEYKKITNMWSRGKKLLVKLTYANGEIKCTENHPFLTTEGWKKASELSTNDKLVVSDSDSIKLMALDKIEFTSEEENVYDLEVEDNHNFIVYSKNNNTIGLIAHNCQNLSKEEMKTVLTRAGEGTKVILTGDLEQIDNSKLNAMDNGLFYIIEKFRNFDIAGHMTFTQGERSRLATLASEIL